MNGQPAQFAVGDVLYFYASQAKYHEATVLEVEQNPLSGRWRYHVEYVGLLEETTHQWVGETALHPLV